MMTEISLIVELFQKLLKRLDTDLLQIFEIKDLKPKMAKNRKSFTFESHKTKKITNPKSLKTGKIQ